MWSRSPRRARCGPSEGSSRIGSVDRSRAGAPMLVRNRQASTLLRSAQITKMQDSTCRTLTVSRHEQAHRDDRQPTSDSSMRFLSPTAVRLHPRRSTFVAVSSWISRSQARVALIDGWAAGRESGRGPTSLAHDDLGYEQPNRSRAFSAISPSRQFFSAAGWTTTTTSSTVRVRSTSAMAKSGSSSPTKPSAATPTP